MRSSSSVRRGRADRLVAPRRLPFRPPGSHGPGGGSLMTSRFEQGRGGDYDGHSQSYTWRDSSLRTASASCGLRSELRAGQVPGSRLTSGASRSAGRQRWLPRRTLFLILFASCRRCSTVEWVRRRAANFSAKASLTAAVRDVAYVAVRRVGPDFASAFHFTLNERTGNAGPAAGNTLAARHSRSGTSRTHMPW